MHEHLVHHDDWEPTDPMTKPFVMNFSINRKQLKEKGVKNAGALTDEQMTKIAEEVASAIAESCYYDLEQIVDWVLQHEAKPA